MSKADRLRRNKAKVHREEGLVEPYTGEDGYQYVDLTRPSGKIESRRVHELVAETFNGPTPDGMEVFHLDGDTQNNRLENLSYRVATEGA